MSSGVGSEVAIVSEWIKATAAAASSITSVVDDRIYDHVAPALGSDGKALPYPFVVFHNETSSDTYGLGSGRILVDTTFVIRGISKSNTYTPLKPLAAALDAAFDGAAGVLPDGVVIGVRRTGPYTQVEEYEDGQIRHLGGRYRILAQGT